jgi:N utilization substance protein A
MIASYAKSGSIRRFAVVEDDDEPLEDEHLSKEVIAISEARKEYDDQIEVGDQLQQEYDLETYGRTAAANLNRELEYHIQRLIEDELYKKYKSKIGQLVSGRVTRVDANQATYIEVDEVKAVLPQKSRIKGEEFYVGDVLRAVVRRVHMDKEHGIYIELSRTSPKFLEALLTLEVPEIQEGSVVIEKSARIPGQRAKVALTSLHPQVDPVGATVGVKGVRINAVSEELNGENIDCIEYTNILELFVARAMSPAIINSVEIERNEEGEATKAIITLPSDQKSKAIGKSGINVRLASMLCEVEIELNETQSNSQESQEENKESVEALEALFN